MNEVITINSEEYFVVSVEQYVAHCKEGRGSLNLNGETRFLVRRPEPTEEQLADFEYDYREAIKYWIGDNGVVARINYPSLPLIKTKPCSTLEESILELYKMFEPWRAANE